MIRIAIYSSSQEELLCIRRLLTTYSIQHSWADCQVTVLQSCKQLGENQQTVDILIADVSDPQAVEMMKAQKAQYPPVLIFPIAGADITPTRYVRPEIMPCGLFWRPVTAASAQPVVEQMMACIHDQVIPSSQSSFRISGKQKIQDIPFGSILFFEAREKKLALRLQEQEILFPGTLAQLETELPPEFIRCHKSFLVNQAHILWVDRSNSVIVLDNQMELPISRGYKKVFWEVFRDEK